MNWIKTRVKLVFDPYNITKKHLNQQSWKKVLVGFTNDDVDLYYSWFIQKRYFPGAIDNMLERPLRGPHFTIVNDKITDSGTIKKWNSIKKEWDGKEIEIEYSNNVNTDGRYWWMSCRSNSADNIRKILNIGEPYYSYHLTIGIAQKPGMELHSNYIHNLIKKGMI